MPDPAGTPPPGALPRRRGIGLSWKLLGLTLLFVMVSEVLIYLPSVANYRVAWLNDRLATAEAAAIVITAPEWPSVPRALQDQLLAAVGAEAIAIRSAEVSRLVAVSDMPVAVDRTADLRQSRPLLAIRDALDTLFAGVPRLLRVVGETDYGTLELVLDDAPLIAAVRTYSLNALVLSAAISVMAGGLIFIALNRLLVRPMRRMAQAMVVFADAPEDPSRIIRPSGRRDEIGVAEERLADMQGELQSTLQQQRHLADLGLAVSKINHDLRNLLASAQLISDRLSDVPDPTVQRFRPKLIAALDRAIAYCQSTLAYGKPREEPPQRRLVRLAATVAEMAEALGLDHGAVTFENAVPPGLEVDADPDQLFRVLMNLGRNALQALEGGSQAALVRRITVEARRDGGVVTLVMRDTGPGVPEKARAHLFQAFQGSARPGGTGLGLAIAAEIVRAHGGTIGLVDGPGPGAAFEIVIPDRPIAFAEISRTARRR